MTDQKQSKPLSGVRVVDLTRILAGPFCTMNLGDMGAEIVKVERPKSGDDTRGWGPPFVGTEAAYYLGVNRNKLSVTLDLKHERGQKILRDLLTKSDVLIENFKTGTLEKWGLDEKWFRENAPHIVHCQITGYGDQGPKGGMPGYDFLLQAESGLMSITGEEQGEPMKLGVAIVDICTGLYAGMTILAALNARNETGRGQKISLSLFNTSISMLANVASNVLASGKDAERYGNGHPNIVPYRAFACRSGDLALAVGNDLQFARLSNVLGHAEWASDDRFQTNANRVRNRETIDSLIQKVFSEYDADYWIEKLNKEGIPCSKINSVKEALDHEQTKANKMVMELDHETVGPINLIAAPYMFSSFTAEENRPPPVLGQDTESVLTELLNLNAEEISELRSLEVID